MKKFILLIALSVLFCSAPGYADQKRKKAAKEVAKKRRAARVAAAIEKTAAAKARAERQKARRKNITAALAAASEATLERRQAAEAAIEAALAETQEATVARSEASQAALAEATVVRRQAAEATGAPATEEASTRASLERFKECVGSWERTILAHVQGVMPVLQRRKYALNKHRQRLDAMMQALVNRYEWQPLKLMMSREENAKDEGDSISADIVWHARMVIDNEVHHVELDLAELAEEKECVSEIIQKAWALHSIEATPEEAAWQALQGVLPLEEEAAEELRAKKKVLREALSAEGRVEEKKVARLRRLCTRIQDSGYRLPADMQRHELVALAKKTLSEMGDILSEIDLEFLAMWEKNITYYKEVFFLCDILKNTVEGNPELVTVEGDYQAVQRCRADLLAQAVKASYTSESMEPSNALFGRCAALMSYMNDVNDEIFLASSEYIAFSQEKFDALRKRGGSLVEAYLDLEYEEEAKGPETPTAVQAAPPPADEEDPA